MQHELTLPCGTAEVIRGYGPDRERAEREIEEIGIRLPLPHRSAWATAHAAEQSCLLVVRTPDRRVLSAVGVQLSTSRALPFHSLLRTERFGSALPAGALAPALHALVAFGRATPRALRVHVEVYSPDEETRRTIGSAARELGFMNAAVPRAYERTLLLELTPDEPALFGALHSTARQNIRALRKYPAVVRTIDDARYAERLDELLRETLARTSGEMQVHDWPAIIRLGAAAPHESRLVGLFRTDLEGPDSLLAFAWGCSHGNHAHYSTAASTRRTELRIPQAYPLIWDLVCWAKRAGCNAFDFGGVSSGSHGSTDPLGGISDFKRYFSRNAVTVAEELVFEPRPSRAKIAHAVSVVHQRISRIRAASH